MSNEDTNRPADATQEYYCDHAGNLYTKEQIVVQPTDNGKEIYHTGIGGTIVIKLGEFPNSTEAMAALTEALSADPSDTDEDLQGS